MAPAPPKLFDRTSARNHLLANLLVLPGLGSWLDGRWFVGVLQVALALTGFVLTAWWCLGFLGACLQTQSIPLNGGPHLLLGLAGVVLFTASWFWSLATGLAILRNAKAGKP